MNDESAPRRGPHRRRRLSNLPPAEMEVYNPDDVLAGPRANSAVYEAVYEAYIHDRPLATVFGKLPHVERDQIIAAYDEIRKQHADLTNGAPHKLRESAAATALRSRKRYEQLSDMLQTNMTAIEYTGSEDPRGKFLLTEGALKIVKAMQAEDQLYGAILMKQIDALSPRREEEEKPEDALRALMSGGDDDSGYDDEVEGYVAKSLKLATQDDGDDDEDEDDDDG